MTSTSPQAHGETAAWPVRNSNRIVWAVYGFLGVLLAAYLAALILRGPDQNWPLIDGWGVGAFEVVVAGLCFARAFRPHGGRAIPLAVGGGLLCWAIGDIVLNVESMGDATPATPSLVDVFYLGFYPLAYVALVLLMRRDVRKLIPATWLDGIVAGLGAAAVCACFAFSTILQSVGGDALAVATNLAYPLGDVLLLALIVGGIAVVPGRRKAPWLLFAAACALNTVGDTFNLFQSSSQIGILFNAIAWPTAILLMSMSVWLPPGRSDPLAAQKTPGFLLPGLGAISGLAILFVGTMHRVEPIALGLATATLAIVGLRLSLSVQRLRTLTEQRHQQAVTDELTGLGNRRQLFQVLDAFFADSADPRTAPRDLAFLFVDLDHFKEVNDSFGHSTGDLLLKQLGPRLSGCLRGNDLLVRLGGDELGVVLMDTDPAYAATVAQRLTAKLEEPFILDAVPVRIGASIGIAVAPTDATNGAELLRCADLAMYRAKLRDTAYEIYQQDIDDGGNRLRLVHDLRKAVDGGQFVLHYQPQLDLKTGTVSAVEALIRWPHPRLGLIPPLDFLPLAEEAGLMQPLTAWVLDQALTQCAAWWAEGSELAVSVNVSTTNLLHPGFAAVVSGMLTRHNLPASALILEITETTIIADFERSKFVIGHLRALGLGVSIDDFGAGFTSLAYLGSLAVSELKLDRTFITSLATENRTKDLALVRGTIDLGHALGLRVVAEGIEDRATLDLLARMGCDLAQGYFIGKPMAAQDLALRSLGSLAPSLAALKAS